MQRGFEMKKIIELDLKFYTFCQNNSGGYFIRNDEFGVDEYIIIEAQSFQEAWYKLEEIGKKVKDFWEFCPCCGSRWSDYDDEEGTEFPELYGKTISDNFENCFIHYYNGKIIKKENKNDSN
jgi:hypothetical protein